MSIYDDMEAYQEQERTVSNEDALSETMWRESQELADQAFLASFEGVDEQHQQQRHYDIHGKVQENITDDTLLEFRGTSARVGDLKAAGLLEEALSMLEEDEEAEWDAEEQAEEARANSDSWDLDDLSTIYDATAKSNLDYVENVLGADAFEVLKAQVLSGSDLSKSELVQTLVARSNISEQAVINTLESAVTDQASVAVTAVGQLLGIGDQIDGDHFVQWFTSNACPSELRSQASTALKVGNGYALQGLAQAYSEYNGWH